MLGGGAKLPKSVQLLGLKGVQKSTIHEGFRGSGSSLSALANCLMSMLAKATTNKNVLLNIASRYVYEDVCRGKFLLEVAFASMECYAARTI